MDLGRKRRDEAAFVYEGHRCKVSLSKDGSNCAQSRSDVWSLVDYHSMPDAMHALWDWIESFIPGHHEHMLCCLNYA